MAFEKYADFLPIPFNLLVALLCPKEIENNGETNIDMVFLSCGQRESF